MTTSEHVAAFSSWARVMAGDSEGGLGAVGLRGALMQARRERIGCVVMD